mgnify:CR=1 FL=1
MSWDQAQLKRLNGHQLDEAIVETRVKIARLEAQRDAMIAGALGDRELVNDLRVAAWAKQPGRVTGDLTPHGDRPVRLTAPEGWPDGLTPEAALRAALGMGETDG